MTYKKERKYRPTKLDPEFLVEMAHLQGIGDDKHPDCHWTNGVSVSELVDAIKRHTQAIERGEHFDPETKVPHSTNIACCCMYLSHYIRNYSTYRPFFDLPFAKGYSTMADDRIPGSYTSGRVDQVLGRSSGTFQESEGPGRDSGSADLVPGFMPYDKDRPDESLMEEARDKQEKILADRPRNRYNESRAPLVDLRRLGTTKRWAVVHTERDQTVAEHCHMVALVALRLAEILTFKAEWQLEIVRYSLLHDADEAWTGDIASPVKDLMFGDSIPVDRFMGLWKCHIVVSSEVKDIVKVADLACDVLYLLDHGRTRHALMVKDEIHARLVTHIDHTYAPGDQQAIWGVLSDLWSREETYIDDYL